MKTGAPHFFFQKTSTKQQRLNIYGHRQSLKLTEGQAYLVGDVDSRKPEYRQSVSLTRGNMRALEREGMRVWR